MGEKQSTKQRTVIRKHPKRKNGGDKQSPLSGGLFSLVSHHDREWHWVEKVQDKMENETGGAHECMMAKKGEEERKKATFQHR